MNKCNSEYHHIYYYRYFCCACKELVCKDCAVYDFIVSRDRVIMFCKDCLLKRYDRIEFLNKLD